MFVAPTQVEWQTGRTGPGGLAAAVVLGLQYRLALGPELRIFARLGGGTSLYFLNDDRACIPEDPECGLSAAYADNHLDPALHSELRLEVDVHDTALSAGIGFFGGDFGAEDLVSYQRVLTVTAGLRLQ